MSYEPTLIIKKSDLDKHAEKFDNFWEWENDADEKRIMEYLAYVYKNHSVPEIDGIRLLICTPEFSSFNADIRNRLKEWGVEFDVSI